MNLSIIKNKIWSPKTSKIKSFYFNFYSINKERFFELILNNFDFGTTFAIIIRVEYNKGKYAMAGPQVPLKLDNVNYLSDLDNLYELVKERINAVIEDYNADYLHSVQVLFVKVNILPRLLINNLDDLLLPKNVFNTRDIKSKFKSRFLPLTVNTNYYGKLVPESKRSEYFDLINQSNNLLSKDKVDTKSINDMFIYNNKYIVLIHNLDVNKSIKYIYNLTLGVYESTMVDSVINNTTFTRKYKDTTITISDSEVINIAIDKNLPIIKPSIYKQSDKREALVSNPFVGTLDLEVFTDSDSYGKVYAAGFCVLNKDPILYYLNKEDYGNRNILLECMDNMLSNQYDGYTFYVHNLNYDGVFIIHALKSANLTKGFEYYKLNPLFKDNDILKLEISVPRTLSTRKQATTGVRKEPKDVRITLIDSYNLLSSSLEKLSESFGVSTLKGKFPHGFVNRNTLNYIGVTPTINYWSDIEKEDYKELYKSNWNLKDECLLYLKKDLISLLEVLDLFNKYIYRKFDLQITGCLTISRLSFNIFIKDYLLDSKIPIIKGNMYNDIKEAYYGGVTEVYKPYGNNLYYYDVNSLYPYAALNPMCGNKYTYIENMNNVGLESNNLFGFFFCEIEAPNNYLGLLPIRTPSGLLMPKGKWEGWYFSEELKFALKNGYKIKVIKGYNFNKEYNIFDKYVEDLYAIKSTTKNKVEEAVAKSLLNNLLGRFGMNIKKPVTEIVNKERLDYLLCTREHNSYHEITNEEFLISYYPNVSKEICEKFGYDYIKVLQESSIDILKENENEFNDVSLVISAAVTSYARILMGNIKLNILNKGGNLYYTDTDSIVTDIKLEDYLVGNNIGQFKLEHEVLEGYFISSKTYCLVTKKKTIIKAKGLINKSLTKEDFEKLYKGINIKGTKRSSITTYNKGSVVIQDKEITLDANAYTKRVKIYDNNGNWIDTKPIYLESKIDSESDFSYKQIDKSKETKTRKKKF